MCITKFLDHPMNANSKTNAIYIIASFILFCISASIVFLMEKYDFFESKSVQIAAITQFAILSIISTSMCCFNGFFLMSKVFSAHSIDASDLTIAESQLRDTARNCNREFVF